MSSIRPLSREELKDLDRMCGNLVDLAEQNTEDLSKTIGDEDQELCNRDNINDILVCGHMCANAAVMYNELVDIANWATIDSPLTEKDLTRITDLVMKLSPNMELRKAIAR